MGGRRDPAASGGQPLDAGSRPVYGIDLVVVLPAMVAVGVGLWRGRPWGYALPGLLLLKIVALMLTLLATTVLVVRWGRPVDPIQVAAFAVTAVAALALTAAYLRAIRQ